MFVSKKVKKAREAAKQRALRAAEKDPKKARKGRAKTQDSATKLSHTAQPSGPSICTQACVSQVTDIEITDHPNDVHVEAPPVPQSTDIAICNDLIELYGFEVIQDSKYAPLDDLAPGSRIAQERQREAVQRLGLPLEIRTKIVGVRFRLIPPGTFLMGSPGFLKGLITYESPQHKVTISQPFYIGTYAVTQKQWCRVMGSNPSYFKEGGDNAPVECVSWHDCQEFMRKLEALEGLVTNCLRLPTEAEWEYACRAGSQTAFCYGESLESTMANFDGSRPYGGASKGVYREKTVPVGSFKPNAWGLYDMHGNVWEWCEDWFARYGGDAVDPRGPASGEYHVIRGGSWWNGARLCRSASRNLFFGPASLGNKTVGLRVVASVGH